MPFEIRTHEGEAISVDHLNKDAYATWGIPIQYMDNDELIACPPNEAEENWVKVIGFAIENPMLFRKYVMQQDWNDVKQTLFSMQTGDLSNEINLSHKLVVLSAINNALDFLQPYYNLIDLWDSKGYIPIRIK